MRTPKTPVGLRSLATNTTTPDGNLDERKRAANRFGLCGMRAAPATLWALWTSFTHKKRRKEQQSARAVVAVQLDDSLLFGANNLITATRTVIAWV